MSQSFLEHGSFLLHDDIGRHLIDDAFVYLNLLLHFEDLVLHTLVGLLQDADLFFHFFRLGQLSVCFMLDFLQTAFGPWSLRCRLLLSHCKNLRSWETVLALVLIGEPSLVQGISWSVVLEFWILSQFRSFRLPHTVIFVTFMLVFLQNRQRLFPCLRIDTAGSSILALRF